MLYTIDKYLATIAVGLNFFLIGIEESSLYTILPKYINNQSLNENANNSYNVLSNSSRVCYTQKPSYFIISMIFLTKNVAQIFFNLFLGGLSDKMNNYFILLISHAVGIAVAFIYAFNNTIFFYAFGRFLDSFVFDAVFIATYAIISKLFPDINTRGRYFGFANTMYFLSHSIGPVYGAKVDEQMGKAAAFLFLIPMWCICAIFTILLYIKIERNTKNMKKALQNTEKYPTEELVQNPNLVIEPNDELDTDPLRMPLALNNSKTDQKNKKMSVKFKIMRALKEICKMMKDLNVVACLFQLFVINLGMYALPPVLSSWMAFRLCSSEVEQGIIWTFGFLGYLTGVSIVVLIVSYKPKFRLFVPIFAHIIIGICFIALPFSRDWRIVFIPIIVMYLSVGIVEQVIFPLTTFLADIRFDSNYGTMTSLSSQFLTFSGIIGTLCGGYISENYGFKSLSIGLGVITILFSPLSLSHWKVMFI